MRFRGTASFSACARGLLFEERGIAAFGTYVGEASQRYLFRARSPGRAAVYFEDGTLFHCVDLTKGVALVRHDCAADRYEGRYHVLDPDCWVLSWRVTGPRKRQLITSRFIRATVAD